MLTKCPEPGREGLWLSQRGERAGEAELAGDEGAVKRLQVLAAENPGEGADVEKKAGRGCHPARTVLGERAAGHDTVQMQVLGEILAPGVQNRRAAEIPTERARIAGGGGEGGAGGGEAPREGGTGGAVRESREGVRGRGDGVA